MTRQITTLLLMALVVGLGCSALAQDVQLLDAVRASSETLETYSATIEMTRHGSRGASAISFAFDFVPSDRMRIVYTAPSSVEGQTMILNAEHFYTYIPSLGRRVWQDVDENSNDQGEEMGFLYDFVTRAAAAFIDSHESCVAEQIEEYVLEGSGEAIETHRLSFSNEDGQQVVRVRCSDDVPVSVDIYQGDDLTMEIRVLRYSVNGELDPALFEIPEQ